MALTNASIPGVGTAAAGAAAGAVTAAGAGVLITGMGEVAAAVVVAGAGAVAAMGEKMLVAETTLDDENPVVLGLKVPSSLANGLAVVDSADTDAGFVAPGLDDVEIDCRVGWAPLTGSKAVAECGAILIRQSIGISVSAVKLLKRGEAHFGRPANCCRCDDFSAFPRNQYRLREYNQEGEARMKFVLMAVILATVAFARVDRCGTRWAREEAREARQWARDEAREARREALHYRLEAQRYAAEARREARREERRYRDELRREWRDNLRWDRGDSSGMRRIY